jgi:hypothetical protein
MEISKELLDALGSLPRETQSAKKALIDYALMDNRSLDTLHRRYQAMDNPPTKRKATLGGWSSRYEWQKRITLFDLTREQQRLDKWARRKEELNEEDWQTADTLRDKALACLKHIDTDKITLAQIANAVLAASKLQRLATHEPTRITELTGAALERAIEFQLARVGNDRAAEVIDRVAAGGGA